MTDFIGFNIILICYATAAVAGYILGRNWDPPRKNAIVDLPVRKPPEIGGDW